MLDSYDTGYETADDTFGRTGTCGTRQPLWVSAEKVVAGRRGLRLPASESEERPQSCLQIPKGDAGLQKCP